MIDVFILLHTLTVEDYLALKLLAMKLLVVIIK